MTITELVNPKTYGMDAATFAIMSAVFAGAIAYFKNSLLNLFKSILRVMYVEIEVSSVNPSLKSITAWLILNKDYTLLPIRRYGVASCSDKFELVPGMGTVWYKKPKRPLISVSKIEEKTPDGGSAYRSFELSDKPITMTIRVWFCGKLRAAEVLRDIQMADDSASAKSFDYLASGTWWSRKTVESRSLDTVYVDDEQKKRIIDNLRGFFSQESLEFYNRAGIPHRRNILFKGPPGTGKTTLARAIRTELGIPLYVLPLGSVQSDSTLNDLLAGVGRNSIILMEDIDCVSADAVETRVPKGVRRINETSTGDLTPGDAESSRNGVSLAGLLNAIDGVHSPKDVVFIFSTNHPEKLDPALLRDGRVDLHEEISFIGGALQLRMIENTFKLELPSAHRAEVLGFKPIAGSKLQGTILSNYIAHGGTETAALLTISKLKELQNDLEQRLSD